MSTSNDDPLSPEALAWLEACPPGTARTVGLLTVDRRSTAPSEPSDAENLAIIAKQAGIVHTLRGQIAGYILENSRLQRHISGVSELAENLRTRHSSQIRGLCEQIGSRDATIEALSKQLAESMR